MMNTKEYVTKVLAKPHFLLVLTMVLANVAPATAQHIFIDGQPMDSQMNPYASTSTTANVSRPSEPTGYINGHGYVDLGLSVKWATCNVGASKPSGYGNYYAWGEIETKQKYTSKKGETQDLDMGSIAGDPQCDAARANWGGTWRLPTPEEIYELINKCEWVWTSLGGHNGYRIIGPNGNNIFLPAVGYKNWSLLHDVGKNGYYLSSMLFKYQTGYSYDLYFSSYLYSMDGLSSTNGQSVRAVSE